LHCNHDHVLLPDVAPHKGHVSQVKHIYGYLAKNPGGVICVRTEEPDYSDVEDVEYWSQDRAAEGEEPSPLSRSPSTKTNADPP